MDKAQGIAAILFVGLPLIIMSLLVSWVMDDERDDKAIPDGDHNNRVRRDGRDRMGRGMDRHNKGGME